ncbi:MAG: NAD(P)-dependent oxidoreductase, partial [Comamonadaceae bacterium]
QMGLPVAAGLASQGLEVHAFDREPTRVALAVARGARAGAHFDALDMVLSLLPNDASAGFFCGELLASGYRGIHACLGTLGVATAQALQAAHAQAGAAFIACPVFGRPDEAWERDLTAVFGPSPAAGAQDVETARSVIALLAPRLHEVPSPAAACAAKLAGNQLIATAIAAMTECFGLAQAHGVAPPVLHAIVTGKLFKGPVYEGVGRMLAGTVPPPEPPGFTLHLGLKDVRLCAEAAAGAGHAMPVADAVRTRLAQVVAAGHGDHDWADLPRRLTSLE